MRTLLLGPDDDGHQNILSQVGGFRGRPVKFLVAESKHFPRIGGICLEDSTVEKKREYSNHVFFPKATFFFFGGLKGKKNYRPHFFGPKSGAVNFPRNEFSKNAFESTV